MLVYYMLKMASFIFTETCNLIAPSCVISVTLV